MKNIWLVKWVKYDYELSGVVVADTADQAVSACGEEPIMAPELIGTALEEYAKPTVLAAAGD